ncbi:MULTISPECIES: SusC/RagA family TonB-linked outer membrane protein [Odoribacteraceae]|uniref:SusC/RagA family TonB-linked outer membrane protein n=1 Tax=Odoribacteraceae TaxID=1853231 RepID=UPI000E4D3421|nr:MULTISPECIES: SusC/RagA family TonB-linked outer membrane protein [Odoribacteraceae]MCQ4874657.1 SusC/RagA family TonB-linked outer membrane protein [Butyricimonas paravirosa]RHR80404.1 SusC/RagA family TonB-linked outer membrane protein [Odoribacter sp. AF15-53]
MKKNREWIFFRNFLCLKSAKIWVTRSCMLLCCLFFMTELMAQQQKVTIDMKNVNIQEVFKGINKQTGLDFVYNTAQLEEIGLVTLQVKDVTVDAALSKLFTGTPFEYRFEMNAILIKKTEVKKQLEEITVLGVVKDVDGNLLPGVTVMVKGTALGTATDIDGAYKLTVAKGENLELVFSFVGMEAQEIKYTGQKTIDVVMKENVEAMEEVVVTGIFTRKKEGFTGSATQVTGEEIKRMTSGNVLKALEMLDPGFRMNTSNLAGSNPNAIPDFQMRGQASIGNYESNDVVVLRGDVNSRPNQPLFVLDGVIGVSATTIMDLDPEQVESITLLKDAAATVIYGSDAANGVVVVETKAPAPGKLRFSYNGNYELEWPDLSVYDLMNAEEKLRIEELAGYYSNKNNVELRNYYNRIKQDILRGVNTYWLAEPVHTAFSHRHGLTAEGGDKALRYKIYLGARWAPGVMKESNLNIKTGKIDLNYRVNKVLISNSLTVDYSDGARTSPYGSFQDYAQINPYYRKKDENGNVKQVLDDHKVGDKYIADYDTPTLNPLWNAQFDSKNDSRNFDLREALKVEYIPVDNLRLSLDFTLSRSDGTVETFKSAQHNDFYMVTDPAEKGSYYWSKSEGSSYRLSLSGAYNKSFGSDHLFSAFARYSINETANKLTSISMKGFPNDKLSEVYMGTEYQTTGGSESVARALAFMMTLNYSYKQRYAFDYSMSINASSEFGKNNRYAPFWSAGVRWNAEKEKFIQNLEIFDELVLRGTYGITGSQGFTPYQSLQMYTYSNLMKTYKSSDVVGTEIYGLGNPDLKWQQTQNYNVSLDFTMFRNILSAKLEYYEKYTKNTLLDYTMAPSVGFATMKENLGEISNKGYEITLRLMPYSNPANQAYWQVIFTGSHNKSRIEEISNALKVLNEKQMNRAMAFENPYDLEGKREKFPLPRYENGYSQTTIWVVRSEGIDPATGREVFMTRDGKLTSNYNAADQIPFGDSEPKFQGSVSTTFTYKGLSLTLAGQYHWGGQTFNKTLINKVENANLRKNADRRALYSRWQEAGDHVFFKAIDGNVSKTDTKESSRFVMDDNEFYFSTVNLSYRFERKKFDWMKRIGITSATLGLYMEDICRFSTIKMERGIDYPFSRQVSMSLNVVF